MSPRIAPLTPPFPPEAQSAFDKIMPPGVPPLSLFTTLARDARLWERFRNGSLLDPGHLSLRQREIIIHRVTARCGSEYEWGVHAAFFGGRARLDAGMHRSLVHGTADDAVWQPDEHRLIQATDQLLSAGDLDDPLWTGLKALFSDEAIIEIIMLVGYYRTVSTLTITLRLPLEQFAARFPQADQAVAAPSTP
jgi:alkylhydroperoxidase family enzyme